MPSGFPMDPVAEIDRLNTISRNRPLTMDESVKLERLVCNGKRARNPKRSIHELGPLAPHASDRAWEAMVKTASVNLGYAVDQYLSKLPKDQAIALAGGRK